MRKVCVLAGGNRVVELFSTDWAAIAFMRQLTGAYSAWRTKQITQTELIEILGELDPAALDKGLEYTDYACVPAGRIKIGELQR